MSDLRTVEVPINRFVNHDPRTDALPVPGGRVYRFEVDTEVRRPADLGMSNHIDIHEIPPNTEFVIPPGEYTIENQRDPRNKSNAIWDTVDNVIVRAEDPEDPPVLEQERGNAGMVVLFKGGRNFYMKDLVFHQQDNYSWGDIAFRARLTDGLKLENIRVTGHSGIKDNGGDWTFYPSISSETGQGEIRSCEKAGPSQFAGHGQSAGAGGMWGDHEGTLWFSKCDIRNQGGDGGLYTGKHPGSTNFYKCYFENNDMAEIRMGAGSWGVDLVVRRDWTDSHPENEIVTRPSGVNGIYMSSAEHGKSGGGLIGCDIHLKSTYPDRDACKAGININNSDGVDRIEDCRIRVDTDRGRPLHLGDTERKRLRPHEHPENTAVAVRNVHISGSGPWDGEAILAHNRHGSRFEGVVVDENRRDVSLFDYLCSRGQDPGDCFESLNVDYGDPDEPNIDPDRVLSGPLPGEDPQDSEDTADDPTTPEDPTEADPDPEPEPEPTPDPDPTVPDDGGGEDGETPTPTPTPVDSLTVLVEFHADGSVTWTPVDGGLSTDG